MTANPDCSIQERCPEDEFVVVACDGIWDVYSNEELIEAVSEYAKRGEANPQLMCEQLIQDALARKSRDNMSSIIILFEAGRGLVVHGGGGVMKMREANAEAESANAAQEQNAV